MATRVNGGNLLAHAGCLHPLMLVLVQLLQVDEGVAVPSIETDDLLERLERTIDEAAMTVVETKTEQHVSVLECAQIGPLEKRLMDIDGAPDLSLLPVQVAENHLNLERV